jgi:hypothetical protein
VLVQEARERFAHHPLIFGKLEIHGKKDSRKWKLARRFGSLEQYSASSKVVNIDVQYPWCARHDALPGARHRIGNTLTPGSRTVASRPASALLSGHRRAD